MGLEPTILAQIEQTTDAFRTLWQAVGPVTLVLDDVRSQDVVETVIHAAEPIANRRIVMSGRDSTILPANSVFVVPPFDKADVRDFVAKNRKAPINAGELEDLMVLSKGNPLYLRYYTSGEAGEFERTIKDYERKAWKELTLVPCEALNYLSLSPRPLHLENMMDLMSSEAGTVEEIAGSLAEAHSLLSDSVEGYSIFHSHAKRTIYDAVADSPQRLRFYAKRLAKWFSKRDFTAAFTVLDTAGEECPAKTTEFGPTPCGNTR